MAVWTTGPALGDVEAGTVASLTSVNVSIVSGGLICAGLAVVLAAVLPAFARYDDREVIAARASLDGDGVGAAQQSATAGELA
jgi:hypothetical protein